MQRLILMYIRLHNFDFFWKNLKSGPLDGREIKFSDTLMKNVFRLFQPFYVRLTKKFAKSATMIPKFLELVADFESLKKLTKSLHEES